MFFRSVVVLTAILSIGAANIDIEHMPFYISHDKVPFTEALNRCQQERMRLLSTSSDLGFIDKVFYSDLTENTTKHSSESEYWFLNTTLYWSNYGQPPHLWSPCQKLIIKFESGNTSSTFGHDPCSEAHRYICESPDRKQAEIDGLSAYKALDFIEASKACRAHNRHLAYVQNKMENIELTHLIRKELGIKMGLFWIGAINLKINDEFRWYPSNNFLTYSNWLHSLEANESCAAFAYNEDQLSSPWLEVKCDEKLRFICRNPYQNKCENWIPNPEFSFTRHPKQKRETKFPDLMDWKISGCPEDQYKDRMKV